jgi:hypothetical protein
MLISHNIILTVVLDKAAIAHEGIVPDNEGVSRGTRYQLQYVAIPESILWISNLN